MAQALNIARWFNLTLTQSGADAFVQASVATDIVPEDGVILKVVGIDVQIANNLAALAADTYIEWSLTRATKTATAQLSDDSCFMADAIAFSLTTSGVGVIRQTFRYENPVGLYLVEPTLYGQLDSVGGAGAFTALMRVFYEEARASETDILRILNNS